MKNERFSKHEEVDNKRHAILAYVKDHPDSNLQHIAWSIQHPYETVWVHVRELVKMGCLSHVRKGKTFHYQVTGMPYVKERKTVGGKSGKHHEPPEPINPYARVIRLIDRKIPQEQKKSRNIMGFTGCSMTMFDSF